MRYTTIYLVVKDFQRSVSFYEQIFDMKVTATNADRFAIFQQDSLNLCLMNGYFDSEHRDQVRTKGEHQPIYDDLKGIAESENNRKIFINIGVEDLQAEYDRIKALGIAAQLTEIRFIHVFSPYWYFTFLDPDGNPIEVTGDYSSE